MRTHGHREGNITPRSLLGGGDARVGIAAGEGDREGIALGEIPNVGDGGMGAANHHGMCILM